MNSNRTENLPLRPPFEKRGKGRFATLSIFIAALFTLYPLLSHALDLHGFVEGAYGGRFKDDITEKDGYNLAEARLQLRANYYPEFAEDFEPELVFKSELLADAYEESTFGIVREGYISLTPHEILDLRVGRQILTWGTGDFVFVNDMFPKDYVSFFTGRDDEYLKRPSDAVRASLYLDNVSIDAVWIPFVTHNNSISGERLSFYHGLKGSIVGADAGSTFNSRPRTVRNSETALRLYGNIGSKEAALYLFNGFYKEPRGVEDAANYTFDYPRLTVYGASIRGPVAGGIGNVELGFYESLEDRGGSNPFIENSMMKYLAGYEKDLGNDLKIGVQILAEQRLNFDAYRQSGGTADELRQQLSLRLTKLALNQNLRAVFFGFWSPSDEDFYLRPSVSYKFSDSLNLTVGVNYFNGKDDHTFLGQLDRNDNIYIRVRNSFLY